MSKGTRLFAVVAIALVGMIIGIGLAEWRFDGSRFIDIEILRAARLLVGGFGLFLFGYAAQHYIEKRRIAAKMQS